MKAIGLFLLALPLWLLVKSNSPYKRVEIYQADWQGVAERPLTVNRVVAPADFYQLLETRAAIDPLVTLLENEPVTSPSQLMDLRLVGLFHRDDGLDTLLIDLRGNCLFHGKYFPLDSALAKALKVWDFSNPAYKQALEQNKPFCVCHAHATAKAAASILPALTEQKPDPKVVASYLIIKVTDEATQRLLPYNTATLLLQNVLSGKQTQLRLFRHPVTKWVGPVGAYTIKLVAPCYDTLDVAHNFLLKKRIVYRVTGTMRCSSR